MDGVPCQFPFPRVTGTHNAHLLQEAVEQTHSYSTLPGGLQTKSSFNRLAAEAQTPVRINNHAALSGVQSTVQR
jgi:hypothetical protein